MSSFPVIKLLDNQAVDSAEVLWPGGKGEFSAKATWGGGSLQLQKKLPDNTTFVAIGTALSADGVNTFETGRGIIKAVRTGTPTAISATVAKLIDG